MADNQFTPNDLETEEWRDVIGYEGLYSVSNLGRIRRDAPCNGSPNPKAKAGRILKPWCSPLYRIASLTKDRKQTSLKVTSLVMHAFVGPRPVGYCINHKDANKHNDCLSNLEYCTPKQNIDHARSFGLMPYGLKTGVHTHPESRARGLRNGAYTQPHMRRKGERNGSSKITAEVVREIRQRHVNGETIASIARAKRLGESQTARIVKRQSWKHLE